MTPAAVWSIKYASPEGECTLTLTGDNAREVLQEARQVLYDLARLARTPAAAPSSPVATNGNGNGAHGETAPSNGNGNAGRLDWCPIHNCQMQRRGSNGDAWYSHMTAAGTWCRGKAPKAATP